jgi:hypothetical protein
LRRLLFAFNYYRKGVTLAAFGFIQKHKKKEKPQKCGFLVFSF